MNLRVLHVGKFFPPFAGGMETFLRDLLAAQAARGLQPLALVHQHRTGAASVTEQVEVAGGNAVRVTRARIFGRLLFTPISPGFPVLLSRLLRRERPALLHLHLPNPSAFWALLLPSARRLPWIVHWHSDVLPSRHSTGLRVFYAVYRPFERAVLRRARTIIATSPPYLDSSAALAPFRAKCEVVPLGLDPRHLAAPGAAAADRSGRLRVLAVGRCTYYKGFEYLLRAAAKVADVEVHLVGSGDLEDALRVLAGALGLGDRAVFHGQLPDAALALQYAGCDCLCLPSIERTEAFGMVLLEAMAHGKACIATAVTGSGMGWVVDDEVTGLLVPPTDTRALAAALARLRDDRVTLARLGEAGRAKFARQLHIAASTQGISGVYGRALAPTAESDG